jgi:hypothetical protein
MDLLMAIFPAAPFAQGLSPATHQCFPTRQCQFSHFYLFFGRPENFPSGDSNILPLRNNAAMGK